MLTRTCKMLNYLPDAWTVIMPLLYGKTTVQMCMDTLTT